MKLFDDVIKEVRALLPDFPDKAEYFEERLCAESGDKNALLFRSDTAFELGGNGKHAVESTMFTSFSEPEDKVLLFGKDLEEITEDVSFAHLTFIQLKEQSEENLHYEQLKNTDFTGGYDSDPTDEASAWPEIFSYEKQGVVFVSLPLPANLGSYAIIHYSPDNK